MAHFSYSAYTPGVDSPTLSYDENMYWTSPKDEEEKKEIIALSMELSPLEGSKELVEEEHHLQNQPEVSPRPTSSAALSPDSATSPSAGSSAGPSTCQEQNQENTEKKVKTRIAFSQPQLRVLQKLFNNHKYLSPPQIKEISIQLGLSYKQVKTWFQNQRMKLKRTQKEKIWMKSGIYSPQNFYMNINPSYHPGYAVNDKNFHMWGSAHDGYSSSSSPSYGQVLNYNSDPNQIYDNAQNIMTAEEWDGNFFGRTTGACFTSPAIGLISQQKMNFYHNMKIEEGYPFSNVSASAAPYPTQPAAYPTQPAFQHYQVPSQITGVKSNFSNNV